MTSPSRVCLLQGRGPVRGPGGGTPNPQQQQQQSPGAAGAVYASDSDDMMDDDDGGFRRGGRLRSSLPVVRSPNKSTERPLGK